MPNFRQSLRATVRSVLADGGAGFNATYAALASGSYSGIPSITLDWSAKSKSIFSGFVDPELIEETQLFAGAAVAIYTTTADQTNLEVRQKYRSYSGTVDLNIDFYWRRRHETGTPGVEKDDTETQSDAVEDAILQVFNNAAFASAAVNGCGWTGAYKCERDPLRYYGDGYMQRIPMLFTFEVNV